MVNAQMLADYVSRESAAVRLSIMHDVHRKMGSGRSKVLLGRDACVTWRRESLHLTNVQFADEAARNDFTRRLLQRLGSDYA